MIFAEEVDDQRFVDPDPDTFTTCPDYNPPNTNSEEQSK